MEWGRCVSGKRDEEEVHLPARVWVRFAVKNDSLCWEREVGSVGLSWAGVVGLLLFPLFFVQKHFPFLFPFADLIFNQHFKHPNHSNNSNYCNEFLVLLSSINQLQK